VFCSDFGDFLHKVEAELKDYLATLITTYHLSDYKVTSLTHPDGSKVATITSIGSVEVLHDAMALVDALRRCVNAVLTRSDADVREKTKSLSDKEQEVANLRRILLAFESSDAQHGEKVLATPGTPVRSGGGLAHSTALYNASTVGPPPSTPVAQRPPLYTDPAHLMMTPSTTAGAAMGSAARWSGAKTTLQHASPVARQAAKFHSELLKEVRLATTLSHVIFLEAYVWLTICCHFDRTEE
jgi:hypothetical protein